MPGDTVFEVEITSNRPDLLSYRGMAREIAAIGAGTLEAAAVTPAIHFPPHAPAWTVAALRDPDLGPYYTATHLTQVKVGPSPAVAAGGDRDHRPPADQQRGRHHELRALRDWASRCTPSTRRSSRGRAIEVRRARAGEKLEALDDKTYELAADDLVIADGQGPVALAGVMGGKPTGVTDATTEIVLEAAWFLPATVRRTSRRLGLMSDSSYRYERRVDPGALLAARDRALALLQELTGAVIVSQPAVAGAPPARTRPDHAARAERSAACSASHIPTSTRSRDQLDQPRLRGAFAATTSATVWQPPTFRDDLAREVDLIEEIARLHGLDGIPVAARHRPAAARSTPTAPIIASARLRHALADRGWDECVTDALVERRFATGPSRRRAGQSAQRTADPPAPSLRDLAAAGRSEKSRPRRRATAPLRGRSASIARNGAQTDEPLHLGLLVAGIGRRRRLVSARSAPAITST